MKCNADRPFKPCHHCGAEINANWTIRKLQRDLAELETNQINAEVVVTDGTNRKIETLSIYYSDDGSILYIDVMIDGVEIIADWADDDG